CLILHGNRHNGQFTSQLLELVGETERHRSWPTGGLGVALGVTFRTGAGPRVSLSTRPWRRASLCFGIGRRTIASSESMDSTRITRSSTMDGPSVTSTSIWKR